MKKRIRTEKTPDAFGAIVYNQPSSGTSLSSGNLWTYFTVIEVKRE